MDPIEKQERKREARRRLRAQRRRAGQLRGRVVAISLICFALLWGVVFVQMATGNDPVLGDVLADAVGAPTATRTGAREPAANAATSPTETDIAEATEPEEPSNRKSSNPNRSKPNRSKPNLKPNPLRSSTSQS